MFIYQHIVLLTQVSKYYSMKFAEITKIYTDFQALYVFMFLTSKTEINSSTRRSRVIE